MGTRADYYIGKGKDAEWLGSTAFDGYPDGHGVVQTNLAVFQSTTVEDWRAGIGTMLRDRDDGTFPEHGWPWPWDDSGTTDYAYTFDEGAVWVSNSKEWVRLSEWLSWTDEQREEHYSIATDAVFPNMKDRKNVTLGGRSGLIVIQDRKLLS